MVPWRATPEGFVTDELIDWYSRFARGKPGAIVVEATGIRDVASGPLLRIGHDRYLEGLRRLVRTVRDASEGETRVFIQLIDFLRINRRPAAGRYFREYLKMTNEHRRSFAALRLTDCEIRERMLQMTDEELQQVLTAREYEAYAMGYRERVTDLHLGHVRNLPKLLPRLFREAAERSRRAGFDGVELHYAHAYTMASFLSALNTRDDGYGGDLDGRVRLPLEVYHCVRNGVGDDFVVGCRYLTQDCIQDGMTVDEAEAIGVRLATAGMDFLSLSRGGKFEDAQQPKVGAAAYPYTGQSGYECIPQYISDEKGPFGRNVAATARVRRAIREKGSRAPVVSVGGIHGFQEAERILRHGEADIIGAARQSLADPDWHRKIRQGLGDQVRLCIYSNYCEALDTRHKQVTCELWDRQNLDEPGVRLSHDGKRRLTPPPWKSAR